MNTRQSSHTLLLLGVMACGLAAGLAEDKKAPPPPTLDKVHPLVFSMVQGLLSDGESPVVTEINLDAVALDTNQFNREGVRQEDGWTRGPWPDSNGFMRYRVIKSKGQRYTVEYQENSGGSLTLSSVIEFSIEKREIRRDSKPVTIRVLRVLSYHLNVPPGSDKRG